MVLHGAAWCSMACQAGPEASQAKAQKEWGHRGADDVEWRDSSSSPTKLRPWRHDPSTVLFSFFSSERFHGSVPCWHFTGKGTGSTRSAM